jgi:hypothetical protein
MGKAEARLEDHEGKNSKKALSITITKRQILPSGSNFLVT